MDPNAMGYTYQAELLCLLCVAELAESFSPEPEEHESHLEAWARIKNTDTGDERTYDSWDFPKPFDAADEGEICDRCLTDISEAFDIYHALPLGE